MKVKLKRNQFGDYTIGMIVSDSTDIDVMVACGWNRNYMTEVYMSMDLVTEEALTIESAITIKTMIVDYLSGDKTTALLNMRHGYDIVRDVVYMLMHCKSFTFIEEEK